MAEIVAEVQVKTAKKPRAPRAPNFQSSEKLKLEELIQKNIGVLDSNHNNVVTNKRKAEIWEDIASKVSALGFAKRTKDECSVKWGNMKREAKDVGTKEKIERRRTGGGVCQVKATDQQVRIGEIYKDCSSFAGISGGLDSDEQDGRHYISNDTGSNLHPAASTSSKSPPAATATSSDPPPAATVTSSDPPKAAIETNSNPPPVATETGGRPLPVRAKFIPGRRARKATKQEQLIDMQLQYFRGEVEQQDLQKELLVVRLRMLKKAEEKMDELRAVELFQLLNEQ